MQRSTSSFPGAPIVGAIAISALGLAMACGGAQAIDFADAGSGSGSGSGGGSGSGSGSGSGGASGSSSGGVEEDSGAGVVDSGGLADVTEPLDVTPVEEPMPTGPAVLCPMNGNPATCEPGDYCCVVGNAMEGTQTDNCQSGGSSCSGTPVKCASPADCPSGQICCGTQQTVAGVVSYSNVECATTCSLTNQRIFCNQMAANPCPATAPTCALSTLMPGYNVCQQ